MMFVSEVKAFSLAYHMATKTTSGIPNYAAWDTPQYSSAKFKTLSVREQLEYLCLLGHLAPNSHNTQPWRFKIDEKRLRIAILLDRTVVLPESDPHGRQALISIGCCVGTIAQASAAYSLVASVRYPTISSSSLRPVSGKKGKGRYVIVASIALQQARTGARTALIAAIFSRKVVRAEFDAAKQLPPPLLRAMKGIKAPVGIQLHLISEAKERLRVSELQEQADGFVANSPGFAKELGEWILPNDSVSPLGMPGSNFGMTQAGSERIHAGLLGIGKLQPDDMLKFSLGSKFLIERSAVLGFIFGKNDKPTDWLRAGEFASNLFLLLEQNKVSVSIHAGLAEVGLIHNIFMSTYGHKGKLLVVFRAGYIKRKEDLLRPHSPRLPLAKVIL
jgi:hypothetical protein